MLVDELPHLLILKDQLIQSLAGVSRGRIEINKRQLALFFSDIQNFGIPAV